MSEEAAAADLPEEATEAAEQEEQASAEGEEEDEEQPGETEEEGEGDEAAVEEALGALDSVHEEAAAQGEEGGQNGAEENTAAEAVEVTSQRSSPVSERYQDRLSVPASQRSKASQRASNLGDQAEVGSQRSARSQKGTPAGSVQGRLSKATLGSHRSKQLAAAPGGITPIKDEEMQSVLSKAFPTEKDVVMNNVVQLADIECLLNLLEDTEMDSAELQDLKEQAETLKEENDANLQSMISLRSRIEECAMTSGIATSDEKFLQLKLLKMQGKVREGTPSGHKQERGSSRTPIGSKSGKGSRLGHEDKSEDNRSNSEKQRQDELIKQLAQRNNDLSQKVHELERFVETSLKEAKLKMNESSKHDKLVSQLFNENAQLAVSLESSEQTRRGYEKELTAVREKHAAMLDLLKKTLLVSVDKK